LQIGVDSYSYHRLLGRPRPGEEPPAARLEDPLAQARELGCDAVSLQTCFLADPAGLGDATLASFEPVIAWGHPEGLAFGADEPALADLLRWLDAAARVGCSLVRIVVGGPRLRGADPFADQLARTVPLLRWIAARADAREVTLAIENHGDLTSGQLAELIGEAGAAALGVCFDAANAQRVGESAGEAATRLAPLVRMVHLRDIEPPSAATDPIAGPATVPFGSGVVPLDEVLDALAAPIEAGAPVCVEIGQVRPGDDELELVADGVRWLRARRAGLAGVGSPT